MRFLMYLLLCSFLIYSALFLNDISVGNPTKIQNHLQYWLVLHRKSNFEFLYFGVPNDPYNSQLIKIFKVKTGIPNERPTPLPQILGRDYWLITKKEKSFENTETAPYFLTLDVPVGDKEPFGPFPYLECNGQCNWVLPGAFGLHGINGDETRLSKENPGSSGCIRHFDADITYLYYILDIQNKPIKYYVKDV